MIRASFEEHLRFVVAIIVVIVVVIIIIRSFLLCYSHLLLTKEWIVDVYMGANRETLFNCSPTPSRASDSAEVFPEATAFAH